VNTIDKSTTVWIAVVKEYANMVGENPPVRNVRVAKFVTMGNESIHVVNAVEKESVLIT
jgi:hypothetical protein